MVRQISTSASSDSDPEYDGVLLTAVGMSGKCHDRQNHQQQQPQQPHQRRRRSTRFKTVVRRVLVALSLRIGHRPAERPPPSLSAAAAADSADDSLEGGDGCGGPIIMTSTSTVTSTVCRLAAVEEERCGRCNSMVSSSANRVNLCDHHT